VGGEGGHGLSVGECDLLVAPRRCGKPLSNASPWAKDGAPGYPVLTHGH
jgi:hypothetical protein